jgi:hypothetical protein
VEEEADLDVVRVDEFRDLVFLHQVNVFGLVAAALQLEPNRRIQSKSKSKTFTAQTVSMRTRGMSHNQ